MHAHALGPLPEDGACSGGQDHLIEWTSKSGNKKTSFLKKFPFQDVYQLDIYERSNQVL
jgi:hypothetical protein